MLKNFIYKMTKLSNKKQATRICTHVKCIVSCTRLASKYLQQGSNRNSFDNLHVFVDIQPRGSLLCFSRLGNLLLRALHALSIGSAFNSID